MSVEPVLLDNSYLTWLQDPQNDDYRDLDSLATVYSQLAHPGNDGGDLLRTFLEDETPHAFLVFQKVSARSEALILHHGAKYPRKIGAPTPYDNNWYFTGGDVVGGVPVTYQAPNDLLTPRDAFPANTYTATYINTLVTHDLELEQVVPDGVTNADFADHDLVSTSRGMWIPNSYASLCLGEGLSPAEVWRRVYPQMLQNGHLTCCSPLLEFLRYQILGTHDTNTAIFNPEVELAQPRLSSGLIRHRKAVLLRNLVPTSTPSMGVTSESSTGGLDSISPQMLSTIVEALRGHTERAPGSSSSTTASEKIEKRWSVSLDTLLKYTYSQSVDDLQPIFGSLASGPKKEERATLQAGLNQVARSSSSATTAEFTITKDLALSIVEFRWFSGDLDRWDEGLHPGRTIYTSTARAAADQHRLLSYQALIEDGHLTSTDLEVFRAAQKHELPSSFLSLDTTLRVYDNLLQLLLRPTHPLKAEFSRFLQGWKDWTIQLSEICSQRPGTPAQLLRSIQLHVSVYWQSLDGKDRSSALSFPAPDLCHLLTSVRTQSWVPPTLPGTAHTPSTVQSVSNPSHPAGTSAPPATTEAPPPRQREVNTSPIAEVQEAVRDRNFRLGDILTNGVRAPRDRSNNEMCLSYHIRFSCFSNCRHARSHHSLNPTEQAALKEFVQNHVVTPDVGGTSE